MDKPCNDNNHKFHLSVSLVIYRLLSTVTLIHWQFNLISRLIYRSGTTSHCRMVAWVFFYPSVSLINVSPSLTFTGKLVVPTPFLLRSFLSPAYYYILRLQLVSRSGFTLFHSSLISTHRLSLSTCPLSSSSVSITIEQLLHSQIILQKSSIVCCNGPWLAMYESFCL